MSKLFGNGKTIEVETMLFLGLFDLVTCEWINIYVSPLNCSCHGLGIYHAILYETVSWLCGMYKRTVSLLFMLVDFSIFNMHVELYRLLVQGFLDEANEHRLI